MKNRIGVIWPEVLGFVCTFFFCSLFWRCAVYRVLEFCSKVPVVVMYGTLFSFELYICTVAHVDYMSLVPHELCLVVVDMLFDLSKSNMIDVSLLHL